MGLGFGYCASPSVVAAQSSVTWSSRGVATGANLFARSAGSSVGVAVFGALANGKVAFALGKAPSSLEQVPPAVLSPAIHSVFVASAVVSVLLVGIAMLMPRRITQPS